MKVGIESIAFHGPEHYIELAELADARGVEPEKFIKGLGQSRMSIATPMEDCVSLAINAGLKALERFDIDPADIGTLLVGTETGVDHSKPVAVYVHQALGLRSNCYTYETKHACFGAMAAVSSASDWIASGRAAGSKALIIASDIARYALNSAGEPTQGAGAVAMVVSDKPNLVYFEDDVSGHYTKQVMDFWRPLYSKTAFVDGHYSMQCYLDALQGTLQDAMSKATIPALFGLDELQACLYHVPFVKMAQKAHVRHFEIDHNVSVDGDPDSYEAAIASFKQRSAPWLSLNSIVGNIYTGSLFLSLIDLLRRADHEMIKQISLFAYGSGCAASMSFAYPTPGFETFRDRVDPTTDLATRRKLTISQYEEIMRLNEALETGEPQNYSPSQWDLSNPFLYLGNKDHIRQYSDF